MKISATVGALAASLVFLTPSFSAAWGLKTHLWIAQQVLNDAEDGSITLGGREYRLPPNVAAALSAYPDRFRSGNLGPDVFPDPIVGQTTFHPGIEGGWQTDDWLRHLLSRADDSEERAFAYGFASHAAGDIFAHTYVNAYAGDVFALEDERRVELRHFVLEKYIEFRTPTLVKSNGLVVAWEDIAAATSFARDVFILDGDAASQNLRATSGTHLAAMNGLHEAILAAEDGSLAVVGLIADWAEQYVEQLEPLLPSLVQARRALDAAKFGLDRQEDLLRVRRAAYEAALGALRDARDIVRNNPGLITAQQELFLRQTEVAADLVAEAARIVEDVNRTVDGLQRSVDGLAGQIAGAICDACGDFCGGICDRIDDIRREISRLRGEISGERARAEAARIAAQEAENLRNSTRDRIDELRRALREAERGIADGLYQVAIDAAEADLRLQEEAVVRAREAVQLARQVLAEIQDEVDRLNLLVREAEDLIARLNPVTAFLRNWRGDVRIATEEYIKASHRAGLHMVLNDGDPLGEYLDWFNCYAGVFGAVPRQAGQAGCFVTAELEELRRRYDAALEELPEILRWILNPAGEALRVAEGELRDEIDMAKRTILGFITDETTADFLLLLTSPENATRSKLIEVFAIDDTGKGLLIFDDVASMIDADIALENGTLSPDTFWPLQHSVTLAKLSLLGTEELNRLAADISGQTGSSLFGEVLYPPQPGNFSLLVGAIRNIDGNHQWQSYGLPWPRRPGYSVPPIRERAYGRDFFSNRSHGLRFWVDPFLRERVFFALFPGSAHGILAETEMMRGPRYPFPECQQNPFPSIQSATGQVRDRDDTCNLVANPNAPIELLPSTPEQYAEVFHACDPQPLGGAFALAASHTSRERAERHASEMSSAFPDVIFEVFQPRPPNRYWTIMAASCASTESASEARDMLIRRGIARDAYVWTPKLPWTPLTSPQQLADE